MSNAYFPETGMDWPAVEAELLHYKENDADWKKGRLPMYVFHAGDEVLEVVKNAYNMYFSENALGVKAFPSTARMEREVVRMAADLLNGDEEVCGNMTSGGTESIFLAVKTARDHRRATNPVPGTPNLVLPRSAHPAYYKAAQYMDLETIQVPVRDDFRADVEAMAAAVNENTIFILGSAPSFSLVVYDPITELGALALEKNLWLHIDACIGGYIAPHIRDIGYPVPDFDFSVPGVTSISADVHKMGFAAKPASTILYRNEGYYKHQGFHFNDWPRGVYSVPTFTGTRPGGAIAAAWAVLKFLGRDGYRDIARKAMDVRQRLMDGITAIPGMKILGNPEICMFTYTSEGYDINAVAEGLTRRGWMAGINAEPPALHMFVMPLHEVMVEDYLRDLNEAVADARSGKVTVDEVKLDY